jgi:Ca2+-binding EF-hand superfamily protein
MMYAPHGFHCDPAHAQRQFQQVDRDRSGQLSYNELLAFFDSVGCDRKFVPIVMRIFDRSGNGQLGYGEFQQFLQEAQRGQSNPRHFYFLLFQALDSNRSGFVEVWEVIEFASYLGYQLQEHEAYGIMRSVDRQQRGSLTFDELCQAFGL